MDGGAEIVGALLGGAIEGAGSSRDKSGCLFFFIIAVIVIGIGGIIYYNSEAQAQVQPSTVKGVVTNKFKENKISLKNSSGEDLYDITDELYDNIKKGDTVTIKIKK